MENELFPFRTEAELAEYEVFLIEEAESRELAYQKRQISSVSDNLKAFRRSRRLKKMDVANFMGVTTRTYYAYESGQRSIPSEALVKLAIETDVDIHELLMGRPATKDADIVRAALIDARAINFSLRRSHPELDETTRILVANTCISTDWGSLPRVHPKVIDAAILDCDYENFLKLDVPSPPDFRDYRGDFQRYEADMAAWNAIVGT